MNTINRDTLGLYKQLSSEKIIMGIKNPDLKISFFKSYIWVALLVPMLGFITCLEYRDIIRGIDFIIPSIATVLFGYSLLSQSYKLYFLDNKLIIKNKLNKKIFDIDKYPKIYIRYRKYKSYSSHTAGSRIIERYDLHIEQNDIEFVCDINNIGKDKIKLLVDSLEIKDKQEVSEQEWKASSNNKEKSFFEYMKMLNDKEKIIGVKQRNSINIAKGKNIIFYFLSCIFIACICLAMWLAYIKMFDVAIFMSIFLVVLFVVLIEERNSLFIRISYPKEDTIKINKYVLNYKNNHIMINLQNYQLPTSNQKYDYKLIISGNFKRYSIDIADAQVEKIGEFIENLIFEEKKL